VDDLIPVAQKMNHMDVHQEDAAGLDFDWFNQLEERQDIRVIPMQYPWELFGRDHQVWCDLFYSCLERGADMYGAWDGTPHHGDDGKFTKLDIGYADPMEPPAAPVGGKYRLQTLEGFRTDRYQYYEVV